MLSLNDRYGMWSVIEDRGRRVFCRCDCGTEREVLRTDLYRSNPQRRSTSCGCARAERFGNVNRVHGMANRSREYKAWKAMRQRCNNPNDAAYKYYGARGVSVCTEWDSFEAFYRDMGDRPDGYTLERVDTNGHYCKDNCEWATRKKQARNRRITRMVDVDGVAISLGEACEETGVNYYTAYSRIVKRKRSADDLFQSLAIDSVKAVV